MRGGAEGVRGWTKSVRGGERGKGSAQFFSSGDHS